MNEGRDISGLNKVEDIVDEDDMNYHITLRQKYKRMPENTPEQLRIKSQVLLQIAISENAFSGHIQEERLRLKNMINSIQNKI